MGVLIAVAVGGGLTYTGQSVIIEGRTFVNTMLDYASFNPGRFVDEDKLTPYSLTLDEFSVTYQPPGTAGAGQAGDFIAHLTTELGGEAPQEGEVRVNHPLEVAGDKIYLMGNGYAPTITIRNADGDIVFQESVPFLPQDAQHDLARRREGAGRSAGAARPGRLLLSDRAGALDRGAHLGVSRRSSIPCSR